jgi:phosphatidate cytidylyltransferase
MSSYRAGVKQTTIRLATAGLVTLYVGLPMALLWAVRTLGRDPSWGIAALVTLIAVTKSADAGAYFTGKAFGRHKLIPQLSPGKTWEGACGGLLVATVVAYASLHFLFPWICPRATPAPLWGPLALGLTGALAGMFGDLAESLFKRDLGVKDSGGLLPGLGGVWDVTDSLIGASLPGFLCFAAGAAGPIA